MDDIQHRLTKCFTAAFPALAEDEISRAEPSSTVGWDSVASVTLFAMVEEEFGVEIDVQDLAKFTSFQNILGYLRTRMTLQLRA